jgi:hypothetical protein
MKDTQKNRKGISEPVTPQKQELPGKDPKKKVSGKSPETPGRKPVTENTAKGDSAWEYPGESAQVNDKTTTKNAGTYKPENLGKGNHAPDDDDDDIREEPIFEDDDDEEF